MPTHRVLLFASYADVLGADAVEVDLPEGSRITDLVAAVRNLSSAGASLPPRPLVAVNAAYVRENDVVSPFDEIAIIPPVAGG